MANLETLVSTPNAHILETTLTCFNPVTGIERNSNVTKYLAEQE